MIGYSMDHALSVEEFIGVLRRSTLAERRPVDEPARLATMLSNADLIVTAWDEEQLIGIARSVTDFSYCCYLSDLAVDIRFQRRGIGKELIRQTRSLLAPTCKLILLSAPDASGYYPHIGFKKHSNAWVLSND